MDTVASAGPRTRNGVNTFGKARQREKRLIATLHHTNVEAAVRQSWDGIIGIDGEFVGMSGFGASAPYKELYRQFGITPQAVVAAAESRLATIRNR